MTAFGAVLAALSVLPVLPVTPVAAVASAAQATQPAVTRVSVNSAGGQLNADSSQGQLSSGGRYLLFTSQASNVVPGDTNGVSDVFVRDQRSGQVERVSVTSKGTQGQFESHDAAISSDGRYVLFDSESRLTPDDKTDGGASSGLGSTDVFLRDRAKGTTTLITTGKPGTSDFGFATTMTPDARYVMYGAGDVTYRLDRRTGKTVTTTAGFNHDNYCIALSADGRYATCQGINADHTTNVWVVDFKTQKVDPIEIPVVIAHPDWGVAISNISADGRYVPVVVARPVNPGMSYGRDLYLYDTVKRSGRLLLTLPPRKDNWGFAISPDGRSIAFSTDARLVAADKDNAFDLYEWSATGRVARVTPPVVGNGHRDVSDEPAYSPDSKALVFTSISDDLVRGDTNRASDVFETASRR